MKIGCGKNNTEVLQKSLPWGAFVFKVSLIFSLALFRAAETDSQQCRAAKLAGFLPARALRRQEVPP